MTDKRFKLGILFTGLYLIALAVYACVHWTEVMALAPNALGDALAGAASPLAFLWLVLGYMQQGEELRLNTEALRLQAEELKASVEQQRRMATVAEQQFQEMRDKDLDRHTPRFRQYLVNSSPYNAQPNYVLKLTNEGASCESVVANIRMPWGVTRQNITQIEYMGTWAITLPWHDQTPTEGPAQVVINVVTMGRGALTCSIDMAFVRDGKGDLVLDIVSLTPFAPR